MVAPDRVVSGVDVAVAIAVAEGVGRDVLAKVGVPDVVVALVDGAGAVEIAGQLGRLDDPLKATCLVSKPLVRSIVTPYGELALPIGYPTRKSPSPVSK